MKSFIEFTENKTYYKGVPKDQKDDRERHFEKGAKMDDDNPAAYKPAPGDKDAKTKESKHTKKARAMGFTNEEFDFLGEDAAGKSLKDKAKKSGMPAGVLRKVYNRGVAAWRTGHKPGTNPQQWGHARVNSFITKSSGTWGGADKDLASKVRKEDVNEDNRLDSAGVKGYNKPKGTPSHSTKSHIVVAKDGDKVKTIRFGQQGASTAGDPKKGESDKMKAKRKSFKARHGKNIAKGKMSAAYWADKVKW
jgi:hypothetical protein|tara:strand:+ start:2587 stop:3333 length:747 start_codon:yes stop_codon:yes gene_type:complete